MNYIVSVRLWPFHLEQNNTYQLRNYEREFYQWSVPQHLRDHTYLLGHMVNLS